jgi:hypothetical protein
MWQFDFNRMSTTQSRPSDRFHQGSVGGVKML